MKNAINDKKYRVATLTFHQSDNYGAVLQAYALQNAILREGYETEIINYYSEGIAHWNSYIKLKPDNFNIKTIITNAWKLTREPRKWRFNKFRKKLKLSRRINIDTISALSDSYDCYIVGSDQVWNCDCTFADFTYFLNFVTEDQKKNSYAASFGYSEIPKAYKQQTADFLRLFNQISVRELRGCELVQEITEKTAEHVLDPVFLLGEEEWKQLVSDVRGEYVFVYQAEKSQSLIEYARKLAAQKKLPIYIVSTVFRGTHGKATKNYSTCGPEKFLSLLYHAKYVVTNSFHGTAFSIIFHKVFYVETLKKNNTNSRVYSILSLLGLEDRIIGECLCADSISYTEVDRILNEEKRKSMSFLRTVLP